MNKNIILYIGVAMVVAASIIYAVGGKEKTEMKVGDGDLMMVTDSVDTKDGTMMEKEVMMDDSMMQKYEGVVLAGKSSPLIDFNQRDYDAAKSSDKLIVLYFYANWCPICKVEVPSALYPAFNELTTDRVIGFRVNYNDNETDDLEKSLAREYGVAYQHTKVFLKDGQRILKSPESWSKERYLSEIAKALK